jgi:dimethylargininase
MEVPSLVALTRAVSASLARCELTHLAREPIDLARAAAQHASYEEALRALGCDVRRLPPLDEHPDAVFVEDTAVVLDELAILARPGADSRRGEVPSAARALAAFRPVHAIEAPGTVDGGDVLVVDRRVFVGQSRRTNAAGLAQVKALLEPHGYAVSAVPVERCLHLKSAATAVGPRAVLANPEWIDARVFEGLVTLFVHPAEPLAANVLRAGNALLCSSSFPLTRSRLMEGGLAVREVDLSELAKAEGALTCCSLIFPVDSGAARSTRG